MQSCSLLVAPLFCHYVRLQLLEFEPGLNEQALKSRLGRDFKSDEE